MLNKEQIHYMFYENGKKKDKNDPPQRITAKLYWSKYFHSDTIKETEEMFKKPIQKMEGMPFIANLAYSGYSFIEALTAWRHIVNITIENLNPEIMKKAKIELYAFLGYVDSLEKNVDSLQESNLLIDPIFTFTNFKQILMCSGIKFEDSKILSRANNLKKVLLNSFKYENPPIDRIRKELLIQYNFFHTTLKQICSVPNEDFVIYLLRYDLKKIW